MVESSAAWVTDRQARIKGYESEYKPIPKLRVHDQKINKGV